jgi:hypothetical protein
VEAHHAEPAAGRQRPPGALDHRVGGEQVRGHQVRAVGGVLLAVHVGLVELGIGEARRSSPLARLRDERRLPLEAHDVVRERRQAQREAARPARHVEHALAGEPLRLEQLDEARAHAGDASWARAHHRPP